MMASLSCGGDDDGSGATGTTSGTTVKTAADLVPDLKSAGFTFGQSGKAPGSTQNQDTFFAIFANPTGKVAQVRTEFNLHPTVEAATQQYGPISEALRNPPPDLFGPNATQQDNAAVFQADQSKSYKTVKADGQGLRVFTDAYRMGRAVVIVYVIGPDGAETEAIRKQAAEQINGKATR